MEKTIHLVYSSHRPETNDLASDYMEGCEIIILEDAPHHSFHDMLLGTVAIEDYVLEVDTEYPAYIFEQCRTLRKQHRQGKTLLQVEPYLEYLLEIHSFFADGNTPRDIDTGTVHFQVYCAERSATSKLIEYYNSITKSDFDHIVDSVYAFAQADSERIRLRDTLRANELLQYLKSQKTVYIEAGPIHRLLETLLLSGCDNASSMQTTLIDKVALGNLGLSGPIYSPGDELTLHIVHNEEVKKEQKRLLCAQALIYNKLITKEELQATSTLPFPHIFEENMTIRLVSQLSYDDCKLLFTQIRFQSTSQSRKIVAQFTNNE